ncbi:MAG: hypothetical protein DHS20C18_00120 [Saprospiraceae bacterium]|nr:MAG: hypothetical protein DHS20C18_00120 [Saprospiraceae bacterium]
MIKFLTPILLFFSILLVLSCNPDCESYGVLNAEIDTNVKEVGSEVLIKTQPIDFLADRKIYMQRTINGQTENVLLDSRFETDFGVVTTLKTDMTGDFQLFTEDPDCGGLIPISELSVREHSFFVNHPIFMTPAPPLLIIPSPIITTPAHIFNAWFSPNNPEYCIWFQPDSIDVPGPNGDTIRQESIQLVPGDVTTPPSPGNGSSLEFSAGCNGSQEDDLFHNNPVTGIIDKFNNVIQIQIDRTSKGLGIEAFRGEFIGFSKLPGGYNRSAPCGGDEEQKTFMLLTSQNTGRQLIMYRNE